ncbi:MAG: DUF2845 domain-containing protein, partial [Gammaproteobacteria bacterium]|nr:DUF2845 domain-containing protein [Gammaproteobacteria bacterium]
MRAIVKLALVCTGFTAMTAAAETLRCGVSLIQPGDDGGYVREKCGDPDLVPSGDGAAE